MTGFAVIATLGLVAAGCGSRPDPHGHGDDHHDDAESETPTGQITVWDQGYEVFAEFPAPVAGQPTELIVHVTDLNRLAPRDDGAVTIEIQQGTTTKSDLVESPISPGIYRSEITFPDPGPWQWALQIPSASDSTNAVVAMGIIEAYTTGHDADHASLPGPPDAITFLKEQQWNTGTRTEPATRRTIAERLPLPAQVRARPGSRATVVAPVTGHLLEPIHGASTLPGQSVQAGELLARLKPSFSELATLVAASHAEYQAALADLERLEAAWSRTDSLAEQGAKSERDRQQALAAFRSGQARFQSAKAVMETLQTAPTDTASDRPLSIELTAPIDGIVDRVESGPGDMVHADQLLFTILNPNRVWIEVAVPESSLDPIRHSTSATVELRGTSNARQFVSTNDAEGGRLVALGLEIDAKTRTVPLIYEFENPNGRFRIGQRVTLHVEIGRSGDRIVVPQSAIVEEDGRPIIFVQLGGETFEKRYVELGLRDSGRVQILPGVAEGERVVVEGTYALRLAQLSGQLPEHGHSH